MDEADELAEHFSLAKATSQPVLKSMSDLFFKKKRNLAEFRLQGSKENLLRRVHNLQVLSLKSI
jgi:hypothetical protein